MSKRSKRKPSKARVVGYQVPYPGLEVRPNALRELTRKVLALVGVETARR